MGPCEKTLELNIHNFYERKDNPQGFTTRCKICCRLAKKISRATNRSPRAKLQKDNLEEFVNWNEDAIYC